MILAAVDDLLFASKIRAAAEALDRPIVFARRRADVLPAARDHRPDLVILDLDRQPLEPLAILDDLRTDAATRHLRVVAFVRHTNTEQIEAARRGGADLVLARSAFFDRLPSILGGAPAP